MLVTIKAKKQELKNGIKEGEKTGKKEVAKKLLVQGIDINVIIQATGLTIDEIKEL